MSGYSELFYVMFAMIIFSVILSNSNRLIHRNTTIQIEGELEQEVVALGQEIIEEAQTKEFDRITVGKILPPTLIPGDFVGYGTLGPDGETSRQDYDDFDDYDGHSEVVRTAHGDFNVDVVVHYVDETTFAFTSAKSTFKKIVVTIKSKFLKDNSNQIKTYQLSFIRNYYAD